MKTRVIRREDVTPTQTDWGTLQWLVSGAAGTSDAMTFGRVTLKSGCANPTHHHPNCEEILYVAEGEIEHSLPEGGSVRLRPGDCIVLRQGGDHKARNVGTGEAVVLVAFSSAQRNETISRGDRNG